MPVRLSKCSLSDKEKQAVSATLDAGFLGMGKEVRDLELSIQKYLETSSEVICVNTGTSALHLALLALDIGPGDEVLVPSVTFVASFQAVSATGAKPVACEILPESGFIDVRDAKARLSSRVKAIMPVHYASDCSRQAEVDAFAKENGLRVVVDAAHSFGTRTKGGLVGKTGDIICFSFDGIKNITCGEGGAIVTADPVVAERVKDARLLGVEKDTEKRFSGQRSWSFDVSRQGFRYHMSNIMAAIGNVQLSRKDELFSKRRALMGIYLKELEGVPGIELLALDYENIVPHVFVVKSHHRDELRAFLSEKGIETGIHYFANHLLSLYRTPYSLPHSEKWNHEALSLPIHPDLTEADIRQVTSAVESFAGQAARDERRGQSV